MNAYTTANNSASDALYLVSQSFRDLEQHAIKDLVPSAFTCARIPPRPTFEAASVMTMLFFFLSKWAVLRFTARASCILSHASFCSSPQINSLSFFRSLLIVRKSDVQRYLLSCSLLALANSVPQMRPWKLPLYLSTRQDVFYGGCFIKQSRMTTLQNNS